MRQLFDNEDILLDEIQQKEVLPNIPKTRARSILEAFEYIVELAKDSSLDADFFENASVHIKYAARKLKLSSMQTVLLALFVDQSEDSSIRMSDIAAYTGCRTTKILRLSSEIDVLVDKYYLRASHSYNRLTYRVPVDVLKALKKNQPYVHVVEPITGLQSFFDRFNELMEYMNNDELTHEALLEETEEYLGDIRDSHFARTLKRFGLVNENRLLFIYMAHLFVENNDDRINFSDINNLYDNDKIPNWCKNELRSRTSELFYCKLIENVNEDGMARTDCFRLTEYAKTDLLSELNLTVNAKSDCDLIKWDSFPEKKLVYNVSEKKQVMELSSILSAERFSEVQSRLRNVGMRAGFCCLFYGSPGTGKTETVYQVARATGRDILRVDVDKIKSCWVGESEQNMKKVFDKYRNICKSTSLAPILLFNEADAIFSKRRDISGGNSVDQTENTIQNIILEEMEKLDGILIATTNLADNLDKAFERRFLFKIQFGKPSADVKCNIWLDKMPALNQDEAMKLASLYDFSGGEIDNVVRKSTMMEILDDRVPSFESILRLCSEEKINQSYRKIGFGRQ